MMRRVPIWLLTLAFVVYWLAGVPARADVADQTIGARVGSVCYASQSEAQDAYFSALPSVIFNGSSGYYEQYSKSGGVWWVYQYSLNGGYTNWVYSYPIAAAGNGAFPACVYDADVALGGNQAAALSSLAAAVSAVAAAESVTSAAASSVAASVADSATFDLTNALAAFAFFFSVI